VHTHARPIKHIVPNALASEAITRDDPHRVRYSVAPSDRESLAVTVGSTEDG
jgi:hypothetical protein